MLDVLAAGSFFGTWRELGAGYRRLAPVSAVPVPVPDWQRGGDGNFSVGREGFAPSFTWLSRPAVLSGGAR